jgi:hypothetical protein
MTLLKTFFSFFLFSSAIICHAQGEKLIDCSVLHNAKLKYAGELNDNDYVFIENYKHVEYLENGSYYIKSDVDWIHECEFNATITECTVPDFPFKVGEVMNVKFQKIENGIIYAIASIGDYVTEVKFELID